VRTHRGCAYRNLGSPIQKYYSDKKIEKSAGSFCGQKYSIDKSITNRTIGRAYTVIFRYQNPAYTYTIKRLSIGCTAGDGLLATTVNGFGFDVAAWHSTRYSRVPMHSTTLRLLSLWSAGSTPRLIVALPFARDWALRCEIGARVWE
jgi:hypothetical protein